MYRHMSIAQSSYILNIHIYREMVNSGEKIRMGKGVKEKR
jgi:hypothetical protein